MLKKVKKIYHHGNGSVWFSEITVARIYFKVFHSVAFTFRITQFYTHKTYLLPTQRLYGFQIKQYLFHVQY